MNHDDPVLAELEVLLAVVAEGGLSAGQRARLAGLLRDHPEARRVYKRYIELHVMLEWEAGAASGVRPAEGADLLALLGEQEAAAEVIRFEPGAVKQQGDPEPISAHELASVGGYVLRHALTPKRLAYAVAAAVLALGFTLALVFIVGGPGKGADPPGMAAPGQGTPPVTAVATLTAEHDAVWDRRPGQDLFAGQKLQLIDGFAEITTTSGAVALLQGPCTVEMTDSGSELRLRRGTMVGRCLTPESKGFVVATPTARVIDLGTEFGVFVDTHGSTLAEVFDGEVEVSAAGGSISARKLGVAESIAVDAGGHEIPRAELEDHPFAKLAAMRAGIVEYSESVLVVPTRPSSLPYITGVGSDTHVLVFPELDGQALPVAAGVSIVEPGYYDDFPPNVSPRKTIPAGTSVRSYVVRVKGESGPTDITGRLVFDAPILGVMTDSGDWSAFVSHMPEHAIRLDGPVAQLLEGGEYSFDRVSMGQSTRTLDFHLSVDKGTDHFRVFVAVPNEIRIEEK